LPVGQIVGMGSRRGLSEAEIAAYDAPFPDETFKAGARRFPALVPITPQHGSVAENKAAWLVLEKFTKPFLTAFSDSDPVTKGGELIFQSRVPGAKGQKHVTIGDAGHFLQEDKPDEVADVIDAFIASTK
jgi:haloalkane dehalogenase